jgi:hypothetical protein
MSKNPTLAQAFLVVQDVLDAFTTILCVPVTPLKTAPPSCVTVFGINSATCLVKLLTADMLMDDKKR